MFCSACGQAVAPGQGFCAQCGRPLAVPVPAVPGFQYQVEAYGTKVKTLAIFWFVYAGVNLLFELAGLTFAHAFLMNHFGMFGHRPWSMGNGNPDWLGPVILHFIWVIVIIRTTLALTTGWVLMERSQWGRLVAIAVAVFSLLRFPFGTAMGIWTLVTLLGYRNTTLYEQL